ncbi:MAG: FHA domain-containing protein [Spirochaetales bacterium]|nr:FHA domain-containing protein [Spirochaetales bacterium]
MIGKIENPLWQLEGRLEDGSRLQVPIDQYRFVVGRDETCQLKFTADYISRKHAELKQRDKTLYVKDLKSKNGTFVNEKRIIEEVQLENNDDLRFGSLKFRVILKNEKDLDRLSSTALLSMPLKVKGFMQEYCISRREEEVLSHLLQGKSTKKIAAELGVTDGTAKNHILSIFKKTETHSRFELFTLFNNYTV